MKFTTSFEVSNESFLKFSDFAVKRALNSESQTKAFVKNFIVWFTIAVAFMLIFKSTAHEISNFVWSSALIGAFPLCLFIGYYLYTQFKIRKNCMPNENGIVLGYRVVELSEVGIEERSSKTNCQYSWDCVEEVVENSGDIYIFLDKMYAVIIPQNAFSQPNDIEQFRGCINKYV